MNAGYVRLSRDDDKRNYVSIENQKLIINQYVADHGVVIDRWYEDDGISGYIFDRPGFQQMMADLDKDIDTVYVKDFSRLGRHNAKVLLLLDEFQERGKHLVVIDDNYDSMDSSDDTIGIKTWFNERYVKDTSKKIKRAIGARQKEGTLITRPPFGYRRNEKDKTILEIVPKEAEYIKQIYDLYLSGSGYRKIATYLTEQGASTPSMIQREREIEEGRLSKRQVASKWSDAMIKEILDNDFYIGTFRLKKRARNTVHGKDKRVPKEEQCIFENHHPAIIDKATFALVQELKEKRNRTNYRGSRGQWLGSEIPNPFGSCLFCKDSVIVVPVFYSLFISLFKWNGVAEKEFVGLSNYVNLFTNDATFMIALKNNLIWIVLTIVLLMTVSLGFAVILNKQFRGHTVFRAFFYFPCVIAPIAVAIIWRWIYNPNIGFINQFFKVLGINFKQTWISDPKVSLYAIFAAALWQGIGQPMILFPAGLQAVSPDVLEAATIDGAGPVRKFFSVTVPLMKETFIQP